MPAKRLSSGRNTVTLSSKTTLIRTNYFALSRKTCTCKRRHNCIIELVDEITEESEEAYFRQRRARIGGRCKMVGEVEGGRSGGGRTGR